MTITLNDKVTYFSLPEARALMGVSFANVVFAAYILLFLMDDGD